jgi:hypothetical protein
MMAESNVGGLIAALFVSVAGALILVWAIWAFATPRGRQRLRESRARSRAPSSTQASYPPTDPRWFEPARSGLERSTGGGGATAEEYAIHLVSVHSEDLRREGIDENQLRLYKPWLRDVHNMCHQSYDNP